MYFLSNDHVVSNIKNQIESKINWRKKILIFSIVHSFTWTLHPCLSPPRKLKKPPKHCTSFCLDENTFKNQWLHKGFFAWTVISVDSDVQVNFRKGLEQIILLQSVGADGWISMMSQNYWTRWPSSLYYFCSTTDELNEPSVTREKHWLQWKPSLSCVLWL